MIQLGSQRGARVPQCDLVRRLTLQEGCWISSGRSGAGRIRQSTYVFDIGQTAQDDTARVTIPLNADGSAPAHLRRTMSAHGAFIASLDRFSRLLGSELRFQAAGAVSEAGASRIITYWTIRWSVVTGEVKARSFVASMTQMITA